MVDHRPGAAILVPSTLPGPMPSSIRNLIYYRLKPFLPWPLRIAVRRRVAGRIRKRHEHVWPIDPATAKAPEHWRGWPEGKQFAFVLTHDVESGRGVEQCHALATLEANHGFRSSFNFIPEGSYQVSPGLRAWLTDEGFEVGVHDLRHDGRLYASRERFRQHAARINRYLKSWGAAGFRSGFMLHQLDWLHDLDIAYDASTFDTDPFEPQPDGAGTIFPFCIQGPEGRGYVELPYTLAQDSTLFLLFREHSAAIWKRKLDWIVAHGGMALVNIHPDYVQFSGRPRPERALPAPVIEGLLEYVKTRYADRYWQALPREVAAFCREEAGPFTRGRKRGAAGRDSVANPSLDSTPTR